MQEMTVAKLLKYKKRVVERISKVGATIVANNSVIQGNTRDGSPKGLLEDRAALVDHLLKVKVALSTASISIQPSIMFVGELKGLITFLQTIDTKHGTQPMGYSDTPQVWDAEIKAPDIDDLTRAAQTKIDDLQEKIDAFNFVTKVSIEDSPPAMRA